MTAEFPNPATGRRVGCRRRRFIALPAALAALVLVGCRSSSPPSPPPVVPAEVAPPPAAPSVAVDDIPAEASPVIRAHLIKLREMRDAGQITEGDYQSRRALLLRR